VRGEAQSDGEQGEGDQDGEDDDQEDHRRGREDMWATMLIIK